MYVINLHPLFWQTILRYKPTSAALADNFTLQTYICCFDIRFYITNLHLLFWQTILHYKPTSVVLADDFTLQTYICCFGRRFYQKNSTWFKERVKGRPCYKLPDLKVQDTHFEQQWQTNTMCSVIRFMPWVRKLSTAS